MARTKKALPEGVKVAFEAVMGRTGGRGIFGIEDEGDEVARQAKLEGNLNRRAGVVCLSALSHDELSVGRATGVGGGTRTRAVAGETGVSGGAGALSPSPAGVSDVRGSARYASSLRRVALREAERLTTSAHRHTLRQREQDRIYRQIDGHLCPTREPRQSAEDQGYREAKVVVAFSQADVAEVRKERHALVVSKAEF